MPAGTRCDVYRVLQRNSALCRRGCRAGSCPDVHDAVKSAGAIERSAGPAHELELIDIIQRKRQGRPIDVAKQSRHRRIAAVDALQDLAAVETVEAAAIQVEVVEPALH